MIVTGRLVGLVLCGAIPVLLRPDATTVWLWALLCLLVAVLDAVLAGSPRGLRLERLPSAQVRLGEGGSTTLLATNTANRTFRGSLRDAWQPSAGATGNRHRLDIPPGERRALRTELLPTRRGDRQADRVTVRRLGPLGVAGRQRSFTVDGHLRALPPFH